MAASVLLLVGGDKESPLLKEVVAAAGQLVMGQGAGQVGPLIDDLALTRYAQAHAHIHAHAHKYTHTHTHTHAHTHAHTHLHTHTYTHDIHTHIHTRHTHTRTLWKRMFAVSLLPHLIRIRYTIYDIRYTIRYQNPSI
jgi:ABC-type Zn2+ transport system substrate-binding protein/surface adhesin